MGPTEKVAKFITQTGLADISDSAYEMAKRALLDVLGVTLAGSKTEAARIVIDLVPKNGQATLIGTAAKANLEEAALCNGVMAHALDFDDYCWSWVAHPSVAIVPALIALGEQRHLGGKEILLSYVVGFEVAAKIGLVVMKNLRDLGWHPTGVLGSLAAAAASAKLLKLNESQTRMALGVAASLTGGLRQNFGSMTKPFHAGAAARNGLVAAMLAEKGFTAADNILEAPQGFLKTFYNINYDPETMFKDLGQRFEITTSGINFKPYPACGGTHRCIDAMLDIVRNHSIALEQVAEIECKINRHLKNYGLIYSRPRTGLEGKFSLEHCVAVALLDGKVGLRQFTDSRVADRQVQDYVSKVKCVHPEEMNTLEGRFSIPEKVTVKLVGGESYSAKVLRARGDAENPMSLSELADKYRDCAALVLPSAQVERSLQSLMQIESCHDINEVLKELAVY